MILEFFTQSIETILDEQARRSVRPLYYKEYTVTIAVLSPALAQELKLNEQRIIQSINAKAGAGAVTSLRFLS